MNDQPVPQGMAHCVHHHTHYEICYDLEERTHYISGQKDGSERPLRLALLGLVPLESLPLRLTRPIQAWEKAYAAWKKAHAAANAARQKAYAAWKKANATWQKASAAANAAWEEASATADATWQKANAAWQKADREHLPELTALHDRLWPDCPWDGKTIFTRKNADGVWY